jgi:hypothetical protein
VSQRVLYLTERVPLRGITDSVSPAEITVLDETIGEIRISKQGAGRARTRSKRVMGTGEERLSPMPRENEDRLR